jgi:hypothetical protein
MNLKTLLVYAVFPIMLFTGSIGLAEGGEANITVDHGLFDELLKTHVKNGVVSYSGFQTDRQKLDRYLKILESVQIKNLSKNEEFAFYINAYNAWTIKLILSGYPGLKSIKDLGSVFKSPWKKKICRLNGDVISLDDIEHNILRPKFKDPRVHFAINCASKGCPKLLSEAYRGDSLEHQLTFVTSRFVNDPHMNRMQGNTLVVSKIFKWFAEDFGKDIPGFFLQYALPDLKKKLQKAGQKITIDYLDYDWSLNGK